MGILLGTEDMVRKVIADFLAPGFDVLEFGDQMITHTAEHYVARELYKRLGCGHYVSVDGNGRGTVTFDLNRKAGELAGQLKIRAFDLVTDFGTGEHIFDQGQFWRTVHAFTKVGGFIAFDRPSQGYEGHCFWRADESTFGDIAGANGYQVVHLERHTERRGDLVRGVYRRMTPDKFRVPQQGRYRKILTAIL